MGDKNNLITYEPVNNFMVFKWGDGLESYIELKTLREKCPCANCEGEKDVWQLLPQLPTRIYRVDHGSQTRSHPRKTHCHRAGMDGGREGEELEVQVIY